MSDTEDGIVNIEDESEGEVEPDMDADTGADTDADTDASNAPAAVPEIPAEPTKTVEVLVSPANFVTPDIVSVFEQTELISIRGTQIADFNNPIGNYPGCKTATEIARAELAARKCPLLIRREVWRQVIGDTLYIHVEMRNPNEMVLTLPIR